jgi:hypothetical protein
MLCCTCQGSCCHTGLHMYCAYHDPAPERRCCHHKCDCCHCGNHPQPSWIFNSWWSQTMNGANDISFSSLIQKG